MTDQMTTTQDLETQVRELTPDELEHASAGARAGGMNVLMGDGSVRFASGDLADWRTNYGTGG